MKRRQLLQSGAVVLLLGAHHLARGGFGVVWNDAGQGDQVGHQMHIGMGAFQHFGLQQHLAQVQPLQRIVLHDLHHGAGEILADVAQPARHAGG